MKELEKRNQAPFYLHKYHTRMGIGWKFAPTEIESEKISHGEPWDIFLVSLSSNIQELLRSDRILRQSKIHRYKTSRLLRCQSKYPAVQ